jgi:hypothetical protein
LVTVSVTAGAHLKLDKGDCPMEKEEKKPEELEKDMSKQNVVSDGLIVDVFKWLLNFYNSKDVKQKELLK